MQRDPDVEVGTSVADTVPPELSPVRRYFLRHEQREINSIVTILARFNIFESVDRDILRYLAARPKTDWRTIGAGEEIYKQGLPLNEALLLVSGLGNTCITHSEGRQI